MSEIKNLAIIQDLPNNNLLNLSALLEDAATKLTAIATEHHKTIDIFSLQLRTPLTDHDVYSLDINYWFNTKTYKNSRKKMSNGVRNIKLPKIRHLLKPLGLLA